MTRLYHLTCVDTKNNRRFCLSNAEGLTHKQACTMLSKFSGHRPPWLSLRVEEITPEPVYWHMSRASLEEAKKDFFQEDDERAEAVDGFYIHSPSYERLYFFLMKDGNYHTVIERDEITTPDIAEIVTFCHERK